MAAKKVDLKIVVLGKEFVGKTALVERYLYDNFASTGSYQPTIGAAYGAKQMKTKNGISVVVGIWDTAGSERYQSMTRLYYRGARAAIICYDLTDAASFARLSYWIDELRQNEPNCKPIICGCKRDLIDSKVHERAVKRSVADQYSRDLSALYFETSSKTAENITEMFQETCNLICDSSNFVSDTMRRNIIPDGIQKDNKLPTNCSKC